jgi:hypothetical protein
MTARVHWVRNTKIRFGKGRNRARIKSKVYELIVISDDGSKLKLAERVSLGIPAWMIRAKDAINRGQPEALAEVVKLKLGHMQEFNSNTAPFRRKPPHTQEELPI